MASSSPSKGPREMSFKFILFLLTPEINVCQWGETSYYLMGKSNF